MWTPGPKVKHSSSENSFTSMLKAMHLNILIAKASDDFQIHECKMCTDKLAS